MNRCLNVRLLWLPTVAGLLIGCGQPAGAPGAVTPTPTPVIDQSACKIPIAPEEDPSGAGFVSYPDGRFTPDSSANVLLPPGYARQGFAYDRPFAKWLPVPPDWVAPDGGRYAYAANPGGMEPQPKEPGLHMVDVATGSDRLDASGEWSVVAFTVKGVYVMHSPQNAAPSGLSLIDPDSGRIQSITNAGFWMQVSSDVAWGRDAMQPGETAPLIDHLFKLDLLTDHLEANWFARPGMALYALGDANRGAVIVQGTGGPSEALEFWLVSRQSGKATQIYSGSTLGQSSLNSIYALGDSHGVWFGTHGGLYLYRAGAGFTRLTSNAGQVAGTCA